MIGYERSKSKRVKIRLINGLKCKRPLPEGATPHVYIENRQRHPHRRVYTITHLTLPESIRTPAHTLRNDKILVSRISCPVRGNDQAPHAPYRRMENPNG